MCPLAFRMAKKRITYFVETLYLFVNMLKKEKLISGPHHGIYEPGQADLYT